MDGAHDLAVRIRRHTIDASRPGSADEAPGRPIWRAKPSDVLVGVATFLIVLAVLLHVLVGARLAQTVPVERTVFRSVATEATVLVPGELESRAGVTLTRTRTVDPTPAPVPDLDAYVVSTSTRLADGTFTGRDRWAGVQERVTGVAVASPVNSELVTTFDVNGNTVEERRPLRGMAGSLLRLPRDTARRDYPRWDPITRTVGTAESVGTSRIEGAEVLRFEQSSTSTSNDVRTTAITGLWVRPETGTVVREVVDVNVVDARGTALLDARFVDDAASVQRASSEVDRAVRGNQLFGSVIPAVILLVGTMAALVAVLERRMGRLKRRPRHGLAEEGR